jgi:hypothetical protein
VVNGIHIKYSAPNQAYFVMWQDQVLNIKPKAEAIEVAVDLLRGSDIKLTPAQDQKVLDRMNRFSESYLKAVVTSCCLD